MTLQMYIGTVTNLMLMKMMSWERDGESLDAEIQETPKLCPFK